MSPHFISIHFLPLLLILLCTTTTSTLAQHALAPKPPGPTNITKILEKAGQFTTLIHLFALTNVGDQINTQLNNSKQGMTVFAPTDNAFSALSGGTLNSINDQQKVELIQFHVIPTFIATSEFQTLSNPIRTQAGDSAFYEFPLNITTSANSVNITTGVVNATLANSIYSDGSLAVYQVDKVLLPMSLFGPEPPAAAPAPEPVKEKKKETGEDDTVAVGDDSAKANSGVVLLRGYLHAFIPGVFALIGMIYL